MYCVYRVMLLSFLRNICRKTGNLMIWVYLRSELEWLTVDVKSVARLMIEGQLGVIQSMSCSCCWDNAVAESLIIHLKQSWHIQNTMIPFKSSNEISSAVSKTTSTGEGDTLQMYMSLQRYIRTCSTKMKNLLNFSLNSWGR